MAAKQYLVARGQIEKGKEVLAKQGEPYKPQNAAEEKRLVDAGVIDGCNWLQILRHIYLPPSVPTLIAFGLSSVAWHWNEFLWPLIITNSDKSRPLTAGLVRFTQLGEIGAQWSLLSAATLMVIAPLFIVFLIFQRRFIQSFMHSGIK